ncbi:MAG: tetratricopeptide repeat protein [Candidatus Saccharimonadales bacterium]
MAELSLLVLAMVLVVVGVKRYQKYYMQDIRTPKQTQAIKRFWDYTETAIAKGRYENAEKALLKILKYDTKNTAAYNRLGLLYSRMGKTDDAIACLDIASSLAPSVASLYNLGIMQFRSGNLEEAATALEKVIDLDPTIKRMLVFAKVQQKLGNHKRVVDILEDVVNEDPSPRNLEYLLEAYENAKQYKKAEEVREQIRGMPG